MIRLQVSESPSHLHSDEICVITTDRAVHALDFSPVRPTPRPPAGAPRDNSSRFDD